MWLLRLVLPLLSVRASLEATLDRLVDAELESHEEISLAALDEVRPRTVYVTVRSLLVDAPERPPYRFVQRITVRHVQP